MHMVLPMEYELEIFAPERGNRIRVAPKVFENFHGCNGHAISVPLVPTHITQGDHDRIRSIAENRTRLYELYSRIEDHPTFTVDFVNAMNISSVKYREQVLEIETENVHSELDGTPLATSISRPPSQMESTRENPTSSMDNSHLLESVRFVLEDLEHKTLDTKQDGVNSISCKRIGDNRIAAVLVRPKERGGRYQICFAFGEKRRRAKRSMQLHLLKLTFAGDKSLLRHSSKLQETFCTCDSFAANENYIHEAVVEDNISNGIR